MIRTIILNGKKTNYELKRKKVKNINLRIRSDCSIVVSANNRVSESIIEEFLQHKSNYIINAIKKYEEIYRYNNENKTFLSGESFRYLGKDLRLKVAQGNNAITTDGIYLMLTVTDKNDSLLKGEIITKWYDTQCKEIFQEFVNEISILFNKYGVITPKFKIRNMTSRWGSCNYKKGIITLNKKLIEVPRNAIQYVIMHEFIHFMHHGHSEKFYEMLSTLMPDWKARKKLLETVVFGIDE